MSIDRRAHNVCYLAENGRLFMLLLILALLLLMLMLIPCWLFVFASTTTARSDARTTKCTQTHKQPTGVHVFVNMYINVHMCIRTHIHKQTSLKDIRMQEHRFTCKRDEKLASTYTYMQTHTSNRLNSLLDLSMSKNPSYHLYAYLQLWAGIT